MKELEDLLKEKPTRWRRAKARLLAEKLIKEADVPTGYPTYRTEWPRGTYIERLSERGEKWFDCFREVLGKEFDSFFGKAYKTFVFNRDRMKELDRLPDYERRKRPITDFPPYCQGLEKLILPHVTYCGPIPKRLRFDTVPFDHGSFAEIYRVSSAEGHEFAFKLFYPPYKDPVTTKKNCEHYTLNFASNVIKNQLLLRNAPFVPLRGVVLRLGYLMDLAHGTSVEKLIKGHELTEEQRARAVLTYAEMLKIVHGKSLLFVDNNWTNVIINDEVQVCDYDMITSIRNINRLGTETSLVFHPEFMSREQVLKFIHQKTPEKWNEIMTVTDSSELETFAHMIDNLYHGKSWTNLDERRKYGKAYLIRAAKGNYRIYPKKRWEKLPENLREVVTVLLNYPRDDSITAEDFVAAAKQDYKL